MKKICDGVFFTGVSNPELRVFDVIMRTEFGTTYNSYLVKGNEKTAVIDTCKDWLNESYLDNIKMICDPASIDYIIHNHTEPDHSGSLFKLLELAPNAEVICSKPAGMLLKELLNRDFKCRTVGNGETIDLGGKTLRFIMAPFLHWPDSMFTYIEEDALLCSCDVFGAHHCISGLERPVDKNELAIARKYYFDMIFGPFKNYVLDALESIKGMDIKGIMPSHGPLYLDDTQEIIDMYREWASDINKKNNPKKVFVGYVTCYGFTRALASEISQALRDNGLIVDVFDISKPEGAAAAQRINEYDAILFGCPTVNRDALPPVWNAINGISAYLSKGKPCGVFGSYGWSGESNKLLAQRLEGLGLKIGLSFNTKLLPSKEAKKQAYDVAFEFGKTI